MALVTKRLEGHGKAAVRRATAPLRALPEFIVIGAQKAGTTSLFAYLTQHPDILPPSKKEVHFFDGGLRTPDDCFHRGVTFYRKHFPLQARLRHGVKTFEASPLYLFHPEVPARLESVLPDVRLIVLLRDPTERAISHYFHESRYGRENLSIETAMAHEEARLDPILRAVDYKNRVFRQASYKARGRYQEQLERFFARFPARNIYIESSEAFFSRPQETVDGICDFLGIARTVVLNDATPVNVATNRTDVPDSVYRTLDAYFAPHNEALFQWLGRRFPWRAG